MKLVRLFVYLYLSAALSWWGSASAIAESSEEDGLILILQTNKSLHALDAACARLKWIGTEKSIPAIAPLLLRPNLSHSARYALESIQNPKAEETLLGALNKLEGSNQVGVLNSLGVRKDPVAVKSIIPLLDSTNTPVAEAAADALGHIGGEESVSALHGTWRGSTGALHDVQTDALLECGNLFLTHGDKRKAAKIFQELYDQEKPGQFRLAAYRGLILASDKQGVNLLMQGIASTDGPTQMASLQLAASTAGAAVTEALCNYLTKATIPVKIAILQCLQQRGDKASASYIVDYLQNSDPDVRLAAIRALGETGAGAVAQSLAEVAAFNKKPEKTAAREALVDLRQGVVTPLMLRPLGIARPSVQAELIRALGERGDADAMPRLLEIATSDDDIVRSASFQALGSLAGSAQIADLTRLVTTATNDDVRAEAADALTAAIQRIQGRRGTVDVAPLVAAVKAGSDETRIAALGICSGVSAPAIREALLAAASDTNGKIRAAAIHAICDSQDEQFLPELVKLNATVPEPNYRMLALRGAVRLIGSESKMMTAEAKTDALKTLLTQASTPDAKKLVLSAFPSAPSIQGMNTVLPLITDVDVKLEASDAVVKMATSLSKDYPRQASETLDDVLAHPASEDIAKEAKAARAKITSVK